MKEQIEFYYTKTRIAVTIRNMTECTRKMIPKILMASWKDNGNVRLMKKPGEFTIIVDNAKPAAIELIAKMLSESFFADGEYLPDLEFEIPKEKNALVEDEFTASNILEGIADANSAIKRIWSVSISDIAQKEYYYADQLAVLYHFFQDKADKDIKGALFLGRLLPVVARVLFNAALAKQFPSSVGGMTKEEAQSFLQACSPEETEKLRKEIENAYIQLDQKRKQDQVMYQEQMEHYQQYVDPYQ